MTTITVLAGGTSNEREVSLRSGAAVAEALEKAGYAVQLLDPRDELVKDEIKGDVVFPVIHGAHGEDGQLQKQLDDFGIPYVGSDVAASELCFDKIRYKKLLLKHGLPACEGVLVDEAAFWQSDLLPHGFVLKPNAGGSSIDTHIIRDSSDVLTHEQVHEIFRKYDHMLLEPLIVGIEITVGVLDDQALPVIEIIPPEAGEFDYENKYNGKTRELCPPVHVSPALQAEARKLALEIHKLTGCRDLSRTDMIIASNDKIEILETNTSPGMTHQSLFPKAAATHGMSMDQLVDHFVKTALNR